MIFLNSFTLLQMDRLQLTPVFCNRRVCVNTTPQMTCFRGAKVCTKWLQRKVMLSWYNMTTRWEFGHKVENSGKWKIQNYLWLGDKAWCGRQWKHPWLRGTVRCEHRRPLPLTPTWPRMVCAHSLIFSSTMSHHLHTHRGSRCSSLFFTKFTWSSSCERFSSSWLSLFYFLHFLTYLIFFLQFLKFVVYLHTPPNESMDSTHEFSLSTASPWSLRLSKTSDWDWLASRTKTDPTGPRLDLQSRVAEFPELYLLETSWWVQIPTSPRHHRTPSFHDGSKFEELDSCMFLLP